MAAQSIDGLRLVRGIQPGGIMDQPVHGVGAAPVRIGALRSLDQVDGPRGVPLLGNALQFAATRMHSAFEGWQRQYGDLYRLRLGSQTALVLSDAAAIASILRDRPETWRRWHVIESITAESGLDGVFSVEGDAWRRQRRLVMQAFDPGHLKRYFPSLVRVTERLLARWQRAARSKEAIDLQADLMRFTVDVTAGLAFGSDVNTLESQRDVIQDHLDKVFPMIQRRMNAPFPWWRYVRLPSDRAYDRHLHQIRDAIRGFIAEARRRIEHEPSLRTTPSNLLEAMIVAHDADSGALSDRELAGNIFTILLAGEDTTANTLAWAMYLLFENPGAWRRVVAEADAALGADFVPKHFEDLGGLEFTQACLDEAMRLRPVAPILGLEPYRDVDLLDVRVPARTPVFCLMRPPAVDARSFEAPLDFRPERWLGGADPGTGLKAARRVTMPFGAGPRLCPGRYLALCEMKVVLAMVARNFTLARVGTDDGREPPERMTFTMAPVGLRMRLGARQAQA